MSQFPSDFMVLYRCKKGRGARGWRANAKTFGCSHSFFLFLLCFVGRTTFSKRPQVIIVCETSSVVRCSFYRGQAAITAQRTHSLSNRGAPYPFFDLYLF